MRDDEIRVILYRLDKIDETLKLIHAEVKRTNGRVTELEKTDAEWRGEEKVKAKHQTIAMTVIAGGILAVLAWFVRTAV